VSVWGEKIYVLVTTASDTCCKEFFRNVTDSSQPSYCSRLYIATVQQVLAGKEEARLKLKHYYMHN